MLHKMTARHAARRSEMHGEPKVGVGNAIANQTQFCIFQFSLLSLPSSIVSRRNLRIGMQNEKCKTKNANGKSGG
jgi:hypothetical protein